MTCVATLNYMLRHNGEVLQRFLVVFIVAHIERKRLIIFILFYVAKIQLFWN